MSAPPLVLVTGSSDGIGRETACALAEKGARVILHGRDPEKLDVAAREVDRRSGVWPAGQEVADLASLDQVRALAERLTDQFPRLDVLVNNAGVFMNERVVTPDGFETTFAVNHLAGVLLTHLLLPALEESSPQGRVLNVSSGAHLGGRLDWDNLQGERRYDGHAAYSLSKLANVLFTVELARRLRGRPVIANALHPGVVTTRLLKAGFGGRGADTLAEGAATSVHLALAREASGTSGGYFARSRPSRPHPLSGERAITARFYELSCELVKVPPLPVSAAAGPATVA